MEFKEKKMETHIKVIKALADGINPTTGELYPSDSPYNQPIVIRALYSLLQALERKQGRVKTSKKTLEEKQATNIESGLPKNAGLPWSDEERQQVKSMFNEGELIPTIALQLERTSGSINAELKKQGLIDY